MNVDSLSCSRRSFLRGGTLFLAAATGFSNAEDVLAGEGQGGTNRTDPFLQIGLLTDPHFAEKEPAGTRYYRESIGKVREAIRRFNDLQVDFVVELGDFVDSGESVEEEAGFVRSLDAEYCKFSGEKHYVLGNHCVWTLTKEQFFENSGAREGYYSFDRKGVHFVILDACFREDGVPYGNKNFVWTDSDIPEEEREWLKSDLESTDKPTILFVHQRMDVSGNYAIKSGPEVRKILEIPEKVIAVFQGHNHINDHNEINGIHYCTLNAVIEGSGRVNNAYGVLRIYKDGLLEVQGFRKQSNYHWSTKL